MELDTFLLLLGFTLAKLGIAAAIVWQGLRSPDGIGGAPIDDDDDGGGPPRDPRPPRPPRRERERRGGPGTRTPDRARRLPA